MTRKRIGVNLTSELVEEIRKEPEYRAAGLAPTVRILLQEALQKRRGREGLTAGQIIALTDCLSTQEIRLVAIAAIEFLTARASEGQLPRSQE